MKSKCIASVMSFIVALSFGFVFSGAAYATPCPELSMSKEYKYNDGVRKVERKCKCKDGKFESKYKYEDQNRKCKCKCKDGRCACKCKQK